MHFCRWLIYYILIICCTLKLSKPEVAGNWRNSFFLSLSITAGFVSMQNLLNLTGLHSFNVQSYFLVFWMSWKIWSTFLHQGNEIIVLFSCVVFNRWVQSILGRYWFFCIILLSILNSLWKHSLLIVLIILAWFFKLDISYISHLCGICIGLNLLFIILSPFDL